MKRFALPDAVLRALTDARRTPGWNSRRREVKCFQLETCMLIVVPFRRWAYRRMEQRTSAWRAERERDFTDGQT